MTELTELKAQRSRTKACITRIRNLVEGSKDSMTSTELDCRLGILEAYFKQLLVYQTSIEKLTEANDREAELKSRGDLEDLYCTTKSKIMALLAAHRKESISAADHSIFLPTSSRSNLPKLKLPTFSGRYSEYPKFNGTFRQLVHLNNNLTAIEKFNHLLNCLTGPALRAVNAFEVTEENYPKALKRLGDRYDNNCLILQEHITDLFSLPKISKNNANQLRDLVDNVSCHFSALLSLGSHEQIANAMIIHLAHIKLDPDSQAKWDEAVDYDKLPTWDDCAKVLSRRCQFLETKDANNSCSGPTSFGRNVGNGNKLKSQSQTNGQFAKATSLAVTPGSCAVCKTSGHAIYKCKKYMDMNIIDRFAEIKKLGLCINCLGIGHSVKACKSSKCRICSHPHHTTLHRFAATSNTVERSSLVPASGASPELTQVSTNLISAAVQADKIEEGPGDHVFLATAIVEIQDECGRFHPARALLDSASQVNLVTESLAQRLRLQRERFRSSLSGVGEINTQVRHKACAVVRSRLNSFEMKLNVWVLPRITDVQPENRVSVSDWNIPKNLVLADPQFNTPQKIDLLIGADQFLELLSVGQIRLGEGLPTLQKTLFGWIVSGRYKPSGSSVSRCNATLVSSEEGVDLSLEAVVKRFWEIEEVAPVQSQPLSREQAQCEASFVNNVKRLDNGRFMVNLPFGDSPHKLGNSFNIALKRFTNLERKLGRDNELKLEYSKFLQEYHLSDHMELVSKDDVPVLHYYMPHHCVLRPDKTTTKLRVVFDASCSTSSGTSLNDILLVGPTVQDDLLSILFRFRCHRWALTADISSMYRQIMLNPEDRHFQYILWRDNCLEELKVFRLKTVTYGTAAAPYLATRCLRQLADETGSTHPRASEIIRHDFYVDDLITGADTEKELLEISRDVDKILCSAQFNLRKWYSNNTEFLDQVPEEKREKTIKVNDWEVIKALGIVWDPASDELRFSYQPGSGEAHKVTKRTVLADLSRLFDPLGLINPVIVAAKIFMQELWLLKLNWDESLPQELDSRWRGFKHQLKLLENIRIPRFVCPTGDAVLMELHGFSDASIRAYGCCVYLRCVSADGNVTTNLLTAKSKVAPLRPTRSLPCLELSAAELLAKLLQRVKENFKREYNSIFLWTDSEIVLDWLAAHPSSWKTFVCNRVSTIQELTAGATWRHTTSKNNAADIVSRGAVPSQLLESDWYKGPPFLQLPPSSWPAVRPRHALNSVPERRKIKTVLVGAVSTELLDLIYAVSNFTKNCRRFAIVLRFIQNLRCKKINKALIIGPISAQEFDNAFLRIISRIQEQQFREDIQALEDGDELPAKSCLKGLTPFIDKTSGFTLLRVGGRLRNSDLPYAVKCPILLPKGCPFIESYVVHLHEKHYHAGAQALLALVRQRFWIINGRDYARRIVRRCIRCFKYRPKMLQQIMGQLPEGRVTACLPFTHTGVDFCGPFETTYKIRGKRPYKSYVAVFVCFGTRAVHLEVVSDLTSEGFIAALKRFIGRRNLCRHLYCDNATNFVGARRQLAELRAAFFAQQVQATIINWCTDKGVEFHHIPPRSPHFGGIWEAAVKSAKGHLYKTLRSSLLTFEEFTTAIIQIEAILNSRPITALSNDPNDEQALTPAHFLNQAPLDCLIEPQLSNKISYIRRWQIVTSIQQQFWRRFTREYLVQLQQKHKWQGSSPNVEVGTLVFIHEDGLPPQKWSLGRIVAAIPGTDGRVRVADVRTQGRVIRRAIHKLAPLPFEGNR